MEKCINWIFGRGLSVACNLKWSVPEAWETLERGTLIKKMKTDLDNAMKAPDVDSSVIKLFLEILSKHTAKDWRNRFITTNWDYLLQQEIQSLNLTEQPPWMANSHVYHMNGTIEELMDNSHRSHVLLENDEPQQRDFSPEANVAFNAMVTSEIFVMVGLSLKCPMDKFLLNSFKKMKDYLPIGKSTWIVINPNEEDLAGSCSTIETALPTATVCPVSSDFDTWLNNGMGVLAAFRSLERTRADTHRIRGRLKSESL